MKISALSFLFIFFSLVCKSQTLVIEMFYGVNGYNYAALCVLDGSYGKCKVVSNVGNCVYDAYFKDYGSYSTISTSNPSVNGWLPSVCYLTYSGNYMVCQNLRIGLSAIVIPQKDWNLKKAQYGFSIDGTTTRGERKCTYPIGASTCSKLGGCPGFSEGRTITTCKHCPHDKSWHK